MNQEKSITFSRGLVILSLLCYVVTRSSLFMATASEIRQRSDGCGPHPLIALAAASRPFGKYIL